MNIYNSTTTDFNNNGYGFLNCIESKITEAINGEYSLYFSIPNNSLLSEYILEENIIKCNNQLFRIKDVAKGTSIIKVYATHIFYDLLDNIVEDIRPTNKTCTTMMEHVLENTNYETSFVATSPITGVKTARFVRRNPVEILIGDLENSIAKLFNAEIERDNFNIKMLDRIGKDNNVKLILGKNIKDIDIKINSQNQMTRIMPIGFDGLLLPEKYVDSPLISNLPKIKKVELNVKYDPSDDLAFDNIEDAYTEMRNQVNQLYSTYMVDQPEISIKIDWVELSKTEEYKNYSVLEKVNLGDTITVSLYGINYSTRVIKTVYNTLSDSIEYFEIGTFRNNLSYNTARKIESLQEKIDLINQTSILENAKNEATQLLTTAMGGYVYKTQNELFIMDTNDPNTATNVWRWNVNGLGYSSTGTYGTYNLAMTSNGAIVADFITTGTMSASRIEGLNEIITDRIEINPTVVGLSNQTAQLSLDVSQLRSEIGDVTDITVQEEGNGTLTFETINVSEPINITIRPTADADISYLYPSSGLFPSSTTFLKVRTLRFTNTTTSEVFDYILPGNLRYLNSTTYDELFMDYATQTCKITRKVDINSAMVKTLKATPVEETYTYPVISLTAGDYTVTMLGYPNAYMKIRLMSQNMYTSQFATRVEVSSAITQSANAINLEVAKKTNKTEIISTINQTAEAITIDADKVNIAGVITAVNDDTTTTIDGDKITTGSITANQVSSSIITTTNFSAQNINASKITAGTLNGTIVNVSNLNASNITTGTIATDRLNSDVITTTNLSAQTISANQITSGAIESDNYVANTFGTKINLVDGTIDTKNFKLTSIGNITATGGIIGGWTIESTQLSGSGKISGGTITGSTISGGSISITKGSYYFNMGVTTNHPSCSGLNVATAVIINGIELSKYSGALRVYNDFRAPNIIGLSNLTMSGELFCTGNIKTNTINPGGLLNISSGISINLTTPTLTINGGTGKTGTFRYQKNLTDARILEFKNGILIDEYDA